MPAVSELEEHPPWMFALALYGRPRVKTMCLELQDAHGVEVAVVLTLLWFAVEHAASLGAATVERAMADTTDLRSKVARLRAHRRALPTTEVASSGGDSPRRVAQFAELAAENQLMRALAARLLLHWGSADAQRENGRTADAAAAARAAMKAYAETRASTDGLDGLLSLADQVAVVASTRAP